MKVLVIDDIPDSVKGILDSCVEKGWENRLSDFDDAYNQIMVFDPDVIILDWREDANGLELGETILERIWKITFRPIVLFTANAKIIDIHSMQEKSNMIRIISKGDETPVIEYLIEMNKFTPGLSQYRNNMSKALIESLNTIEYIKEEEDIDDSSVGYILSKRTSSFFDNQFISTISPSWVQYLCPPIDSCLTVCDIIRVIHPEINLDVMGNPEEYKLILSPSCDMYYDPSRVPKVSHALCAGCFGKEKFHKLPLKPEPTESNIDSVIKKLNSGYNGNFVPLPGFSNIIPYMTADLKKLELIPLHEIAKRKEEITDITTHCRVASICSPFREQIVWAHLQNSCRPGVPDRNMRIWAKELLTE